MSTFRDRVAEYFKAHPGVWLSARSFEDVGGRQAWRSRIAECRTELGMTIENRVRTMTSSSGERYRLSEYRFLPSVIREVRAQLDASIEGRLF